MEETPFRIRTEGNPPPGLFSQIAKLVLLLPGHGAIFNS